MLCSTSTLQTISRHRKDVTRCANFGRCVYTSTKDESKSATDSKQPRQNAVNIQMLSQQLHKQVFGDESDKPPHPDVLKNIKKHLQAFKLWDKKPSFTKDIDLKLPKLFGKNIDEHFKTIAVNQTNPYTKSAKQMQDVEAPPMPKEWEFQTGWTKYDSVTGETFVVDFPDEDVVVFDVETIVCEGNVPVMATAVSPTTWYSWCSEKLVHPGWKWNNQNITPEDMIPMETANGISDLQNDLRRHRLVIGHNMGFDRSYIKEQYYIKGTQLRCLDTMSLHIAVAGLTSLQRILYHAKKTGSRRKEVREHEQGIATHGHASFNWLKESTLNNLSDVYQLYCDTEPLNKDIRNTFVKGSMDDIRNDFQNLMTYCGRDVKATHEVFRKIWPQFLTRFPHPVTLAGMLEMGTAYLPVNSNWKRYITSSEATYSDIQREMNLLLQQLANDACSLMEDEKYKSDVWLWDIDWSTRKMAPKKSKSKKEEKTQPKQTKDEIFKQVMDTANNNMRKRPIHMPGFPRWFADLCPRDKDIGPKHPPGPSLITTQRRIAPKLLRMAWDGYPLHYDDEHGWGYLVPWLYNNSQDEQLMAELEEQDDTAPRKSTSKSVADKEAFPDKALFNEVMRLKPEWIKSLQNRQVPESQIDALLHEIHTCSGKEDVSPLWTQYRERMASGMKADDASMRPDTSHPGVGPFTDVLPGCDFYKLPHKDGEKKRVGNPLAKDFLTKIEEGVLQSAQRHQADIVLRCNNTSSYWKMNRDRIRGQMTVQLAAQDFPSNVTRANEYDEDAYYGAILPRVVTAGTITRRAVEPTWLTASNAYVDRVGSELKSMIQSPPGYHFVGADVDSQELWIAAILGDANFARVHGSTALGWMTLQGSKAEGTDLHSHTAGLVGISRDEAKVFNYGRIYGAGAKFAVTLLRKFNHRLTYDEARKKAWSMYAATKGRRKMVSLGDHEDAEIRNVWHGGSESHMFNMLEEIACSRQPKTPVLGCTITKTLEPRNVDSDFMTSRVNWVVQSSAVDYLHLLLVCMRWLLDEYDIKGRFCISIHDEVRYLVASDDRHRAALALQISNLLTRSMFAYKIGMKDLPMSVAFFSAVDIDTCLRKEVSMDCVTPSNPV